MSNTTKWICALIGFAICYNLGWIMPILWFGLLALIVILLILPKTDATSRTRQRTHNQSMPAQVGAAHAQSSSPVAALESLIASEGNPDVKRGLQRALEVVRNDTAWSPQQAYVQPALQNNPQPALTEAEKAEQKKRQELRNVNTILYTASFLLIGAAALFISFNDLAGPMVKFGTILVVAIVFYVSGLVLHRQSTRLLPAATAFVGTGLALIPFVGLALNSFVLSDPSLAWWITSLVGIVAFLFAITQIRTTLMTYLTLAFLFSLATSSVSVLDAPFVWYFVSIIVTSSFLMYLSFKLPSSFPATFKQPLENNAQLATPIALLGSLFMWETADSFDYVIISGVGALHYLVNALGFATDKTRFVYWAAGRALTVVFAATLTYHFTESWTWTCMTLLASAALTHFYSIANIRKDSRESGWLWASQGLVVLSLTGFFDDMASLSGALGVLLVLSLHQLYVMRRFEYGLAAIAALLALPLTLLRGVVDPAVGYDAVACVTLALAATALFDRWLLSPRHTSFRRVSSLAYALFIVETVFIGFFGSAVSGDWMLYGVVLGLAGVVLYLAAFVERQPVIHIISNLLVAIGVYLMYGASFDWSIWVPLATGLTLGAIWYGLSWYFRRPEAVAPEDQPRSIIMAVSAVTVLGLAALIGMFDAPQTVVASALVGCLAAGLLAYEGKVRNQMICYEVAAYVATFSLQRLVAHVYPGADWLVYTHWWALSVGLVALLYLERGTVKSTNVVSRAVIALAIVSVPSGIAALMDSTGGYRTLFLLEHVVIAIAGLALSKKLAVQWGSIGIGLAVLYMLQGYTYILLTLVAFGLIGFAIWRLVRKG